MTAKEIDSLTDQELKDHVALYHECADTTVEKLTLEMLLETMLERNL